MSQETTFYCRYCITWKPLDDLGITMPGGRKKCKQCMKRAKEKHHSEKSNVKAQFDKRTPIIIP